MASDAAFAHQGHDHGTMPGMHEMAVTVTAIDHKTGIVNVSAGDMKLTVHFPPTSLAEVKEGDKITLHLGFTKTP
ncbi:hypothetical protein ELE36_10380 [Pseudolysobacter antarcticus]|uniref:Copper-binding protein n=2 Tax=Pseudolysobacter antarcticus TaxID=2511995 RepID=A0A411HQ79_9GAMM|nr:hypothetical protein ELE36_10380 [Pseudolysobacter antarcticus]